MDYQREKNGVMAGIRRMLSLVEDGRGSQGEMQFLPADRLDRFASRLEQVVLLLTAAEIERDDDHSLTVTITGNAALIADGKQPDPWVGIFDGNESCP